MKYDRINEDLQVDVILREKGGLDDISTIGEESRVRSVKSQNQGCD